MTIIIAREDFSIPGSDQDEAKARAIEPFVTTPARRVRAIERLAKAGIRVGVMVAPIIPGLTEHEMPAILKAAAEAGARCAGYTIVRLPMESASISEASLSAAVK